MKSSAAQILRGKPLSGRGPWILLLGLLSSSGCLEGDRTTVEPSKIEMTRGHGQSGLPGQIMEPLVVRVEGAKSVDFLGRRGKRPPAVGVTVTFEVELPDEVQDASPAGAIPPHPLLFPIDAPLDAEESSTEGVTELPVETDSEGYAQVKVQLGSRNGKWNVEAKTENKEKVRFRLTTGVEVEPGPLEGVVDTKVPIRLWLRHLEDPSDLASMKPLEGRDIVFRSVGTPTGRMEDEELRDKRNDTDSDGLRETEISLGDEPGYYYVLAEFEPGEGDDPIPPITFRILAMDWVLVGLKLGSGLLVFLIGVSLLGKGFLLLTSRYMHLPTGPWARNRVQGYLGGVVAGVTFESSSLVTSYLVSLANGGLITAAGGLALLLGANLGGTILPQLLALEIDQLAVPLLALGVLFAVFPRRIGLLSWCLVLVGGGLVLAGYSLMDASVSLASLSERLQDGLLARAIDCSLPLSSYLPRFFSHFVLAAGVAFLLRTSNLPVVVTMIAASFDLVNFATAVPIVLGANLGSAAIGFVRAIGKRREARRLALSNLVLQLLGCAGAVVISAIVIDGRSLFDWVVDGLTPNRLFSAAPASVEQRIAAAHTVFNLLTGVGALFLARYLLAIVDWLHAPATLEPQVKPFLLDRNLIPVPALALRQATEETSYMTEICRKTVAEAFDAFRYDDTDLAEQVPRREEVIIGIHREVSQYLAEVGENQLSRLDSSRLETLQTAASCLLRIGDLSERFRDLTQRKIEEHVGAADEVDRELNEVYDLVMAQFANILSLLKDHDAKTEENAVKMVERLAKFSSRFESQWRQRIEQAESKISPLALHLQTVIYQEAFGILFQIAEQLAHVAERMRLLRPERF